MHDRGNPRHLDLTNLRPPQDGREVIRMLSLVLDLAVSLSVVLGL